MGKGREERGGTRKEVPALGGGASTWSRRYITHKGAISPGSETTHSSAGSASPPIGNDQAIRGRVGGVQRECAARARLPLAEKETPRRPTWPPRLEGARLRRDMRKPSLTEAPRASARLQPAPTLTGGRLRPTPWTTPWWSSGRRSPWRCRAAPRPLHVCSQTARHWWNSLSPD